MPGGRPSKIGQVALIDEDGYEVKTGDLIVDRVLLGMDYTTACDAAGVSRTRLYQWRLKGARLRAQQAQGKLPDPTATQQHMIAFAQNLERAEAMAEASRLGIIHRAAIGGTAHVKTTEKRDAKGVLIETTTISETLDPQWTAAAWWLERRRGYVKRYEVTGAEGAPLVPADEAARGMADALRAYLAGHDDAIAATKEIAP